MNIPSLHKEMLHYFSQLSVAEQKSFLELVKTIVLERKENFKQPSVDEYNRSWSRHTQE